MAITNEELAAAVTTTQGAVLKLVGSVEKALDGLFGAVERLNAEQAEMRDGLVSLSNRIESVAQLASALNARLESPEGDAT
jgi:hypothetical protein